MTTLWFKRCYVGPILEGSKRTTIRAKPPRFGVGQTVAATVGPRPPFALLDVQQIEELPLGSLAPEEADGLDAFYPGVSEFYRVTFSARPA